MPSHVVIGGGITGLAACWYLAKAGHSPVLVEKEKRLGGVIRTDQVEGCLIEGGPDSWLAAKPAALELVRELGLEKDIVGSNDDRRLTSIVKGGKLVPMPDGLMMMVPTKFLPVLTSPLLSLGTKLRMGLDYFKGATPDLPERSVAEMVRAHYGQEAVDYLAEPLLAGVYGGDPERLSADAVLERFVAIEKKYGSLTKGILAGRSANKAAPGPLFLTLKGGVEQLTNAIIGQLAGKLDRWRDEVSEIRKSNFGYEIRLKDQSIFADHVIVCCPAYAAGKMLATVDEPLAGLLGAIKYNSSVTVALGYDQADVEGKIQGLRIPGAEGRAQAHGGLYLRQDEVRLPRAAGQGAVALFLRARGDRRARCRTAGGGARRSARADGHRSNAGLYPHQSIARGDGAV